MKQFFTKSALPILLTLALCLSLTPALAAGTTTAALKIGCNQMAVGTALQPVDDQNAAVAPIAENYRTLVPVSRIVAAFGGKSAWDADTNAATFTLGSKTVTHVIGSDTVTTPSGVKTMEVPSKALNNRTYIPVRYVLEGLGLHVGYEPTQQLIVVSTANLDGQNLLTLSPSQTLLDAQTLNALPAAHYTSGTQIAPARTKADMEPQYTDGAYIQDLGSATGFTIYRDNTSSIGNIYGYICDYDLSDEEVLDEVEAYVDLLAAQPDLELVRPFGEDDTGAFYFAYLNYTGDQARMKGNLDAWLWDDRTAHVEVYVSLPVGYRTSWEVMVSLDENLKYADLGLRTPQGAALLSPYQISGSRVGDAYYLDGGVYYNSGDKALSTLSGYASLLIDGQSHAATANFQTELKDKITLSGFDGTDSIELSFAADEPPVTGDVYGLDELRYEPRDSTWGPYLCLDYGDYEFATPVADGERQVTEATVRVLRWDKSGSGDTVVYFHFLADISGVTREYEGLAAVPWTNLNTSFGIGSGSGSSSGSGSGTSLPSRPGGVTCSVCGGDGKRECGSCGGKGYFERRKSTPNYSGSGPKYYTVKETCGACRGTGEKTCTYCGGDGKVGS